jgi:hypothetical protein
MITKTIYKSGFIHEFEKVRPDNFTTAGLEALYEYLDELGEDIELDVTALCCEFSEYDSAWDACEAVGYTEDDISYSFDEDEEEGNTEFNEDDREEKALDYLHDNHTVINVRGGGVIITD